MYEYAINQASLDNMICIIPITHDHIPDINEDGGTGDPDYRSAVVLYTGTRV